MHADVACYIGHMMLRLSQPGIDLDYKDCCNLFKIAFFLKRQKNPKIQEKVD